MKEKEYAVYKGECILAMGTIKEIAKTLKIKPKSVKFYGTRVYNGRTSENARRLVCLD